VARRRLRRCKDPTDDPPAPRLRLRSLLSVSQGDPSFHLASSVVAVVPPRTVFAQGLVMLPLSPYRGFPTCDRFGYSGAKSMITFSPAAILTPLDLGVANFLLRSEIRPYLLVRSHRHSPPPNFPLNPSVACEPSDNIASSSQSAVLMAFCGAPSILRTEWAPSSTRPFTDRGDSVKIRVIPLLMFLFERSPTTRMFPNLPSPAGMSFSFARAGLRRVQPPPPMTSSPKQNPCSRLSLSGECVYK